MNDLEHWINPILEDLKSQELERSIRVFPDEAEEGVEAGAAELNFSSNDYLNLSRHPAVISAARDIQSAGAGAARLVSGTSSCHVELEQALASHHGYESCLLFGAGYLANIGLLSTILRRHDTVFGDKLIHASLIDGITLSKAKHMRYRHCDLAHLEDSLKKAHLKRMPDTRFVIVTESIFSMDGDPAPLEEICQIACRYDALLHVDEAHALGIYGERGEGLVAAQSLQDKTAIVTGTLSKSYGAYGGFVLCSERMKALLVNKARPFIYNTALPSGVIQAGAAALRVIQQNPGLGSEVLARAALFRKQLTDAGFDTLNSQTHIVPLLVGENAPALALSERLRKRGLVAIAMRAPTVPAGSSRLRFSLTLGLSREDVNRGAAIVVKEASEVLSR